MLDLKVTESLVMSLSRKTQLSTSVESESRTSRFRVDTLFHCVTPHPTQPDPRIRFTQKTSTLDLNYRWKVNLWSETLAIKVISTEKWIFNVIDTYLLINNTKHSFLLECDYKDNLMTIYSCNLTSCYLPCLSPWNLALT